MVNLEKSDATCSVAILGAALDVFGQQKCALKQKSPQQVIWGDVIVDARAPGSAMVDHIGMGKAGGRVLAVAERKRRRRHDEAKRRERCKNDREPKAEPDGERSQHSFRMVFINLHSEGYWLETDSTSKDRNALIDS